MDESNNRILFNNEENTSFQILPTIENTVPPFFEFCTISIENQFDNYTKQGIYYNLKILGAKIQENVDMNVTHLLVNYKNGIKYEKALEINKKEKAKIEFVSLFWLFNCIQLKKYQNPKNFIYHPITNSNGIEEMRNKIISVSGFIGQERSILKYIIKSCGAKYSGALSKKENTHLIAYLPSGEKFKKALEWNIVIVNKMWIYDCFKRWKILNEKYYFDIDVDR